MIWWQSETLLEIFPVCICFNQELQITYGHGVVSMEF